MDMMSTLSEPQYVQKLFIHETKLAYLEVTIPKSVDTYYPDTKISITEYNYGGENHISGGLAMADVLGIYGKDNVFCATCCFPGP
jgi:mannan endo-1,4-beta-mannosidase